jgi:hypothetical protein
MSIVVASEQFRGSCRLSSHHHTSDVLPTLHGTRTLRNRNFLIFPTIMVPIDESSVGSYVAKPLKISTMRTVVDEAYVFGTSVLHPPSPPTHCTSVIDVDQLHYTPITMVE